MYVHSLHPIKLIFQSRPPLLRQCHRVESNSMISCQVHVGHRDKDKECRQGNLPQYCTEQVANAWELRLDLYSTMEVSCTGITQIIEWACLHWIVYHTASEIATQHNSRPACGYPNCYTKSRGIPLRVRYEVEILGWCTSTVQVRTTQHIISIEYGVDNLLSAWVW